MARGNKRGPDEMGPMTGRGLGYCNNYNSPGFTKGNPLGGGGGGGFKRGFRNFSGRGFRNFFGKVRDFDWRINNIPNNSQEFSKDDEKDMLKSNIENAENEIKLLQKRLEELESKDNS